MLKFNWHAFLNLDFESRLPLKSNRVFLWRMKCLAEVFL